MPWSPQSSSGAPPTCRCVRTGPAASSAAGLRNPSDRASGPRPTPLSLPYLGLPASVGLSACGRCTQYQDPKFGLAGPRAHRACAWCTRGGAPRAVRPRGARSGRARTARAGTMLPKNPPLKAPSFSFLVALSFSVVTSIQRVRCKNSAARRPVVRVQRTYWECSMFVQSAVEIWRARDIDRQSCKRPGCRRVPSVGHFGAFQACRRPSDSCVQAPRHLRPCACAILGSRASGSRRIPTITAMSGPASHSESLSVRPVYAVPQPEIRSGT